LCDTATETNPDQVLRLATTSPSPSTNNQAERELRSVKTQKKISRAHRSETSKPGHASEDSTAREHDVTA